MPLFIWKPSYEIGVLELDHDHRHLVGLINELYEAMKVGHGYELVNQMIDRLLTYAVEHFNTEEGFMRASNYPYFDVHVREHDAFRARIVEMDQNRREGLLLPSTEMLTFLCDWLKTHILESDKTLGRFIKRQRQD